MTANMDWELIKSELSATTKQKLHGLESLAAICDKEPLHIDLTLEFVDLVAQATLQLLSAIITREGEGVRAYTSSILPMVVGRLADARQQVRQEACDVLLSMLEAITPSFVLEKMSRFWSHRHWKVRHGILQTVAEAVSRGTPGLLSNKDQNSYLITQVINLVEDPNETVRDASLDCLQEMYMVLGEALVEDLRHQAIRPASMKEVIMRLDEHSPTNMDLPDVKSGTGSTPTSRKTTKDNVATPHSHAQDCDVALYDVDQTAKRAVAAKRGQF
eukprot:gene2597-30992_t